MEVGEGQVTTVEGLDSLSDSHKTPGGRCISWIDNFAMERHNGLDLADV